MSKCAKKARIYKDIEKCRGRKNLPGTRAYFYGISLYDVITMPKYNDTPEDLKAAATLVGDFVLAADVKWHKVGMVVDEGTIQTENQGTEGNKSFKNTFTGVIPGTEEEATGYINEMNNDQMIFLVPQRNGKFRLVGNKEFPAVLSLKQELGKTATDANTTTVEAVATDYWSAPFYTGKIETEDGVISGETGELVTEDAGGKAAQTGQG